MLLEDDMRAKKAKNLMFKRPALASCNYEYIDDELSAISEACDDVRYFVEQDMDVGLGSFGSAKWVIIGAETGNRKNKVVPQKHWIDLICDAADITHMAVFMKDSLIPIMGEENMRREFPWDK